MNISINEIVERIKKVPTHYWILGVILIVGIFLRTYQFRDWMTFNPDQARDALLVQDMISGKQWPLMGPQAGNTLFKLGPIFYYFEFIGAWIFGPSAEHMAYTDLFFSLASIILIYIFLKKFFEEKIALFSTFLFALSFFVVTYSRFAFNPNSIPFFVLLFLLSLLAIIDGAPKEKLGWAALLGISMGVGFQLHTILFVSMPLLASLVLLYLFIKKNFIWKSVLVTLFFFFLANTGQLLFEIKNDGANIKSFFTDAQSSTESAGRNYVEDFSSDMLCHIQGTLYIASSLGNGDKCDLTKLVSRIEKKGISFNAGRIAIAIFGTVFTIGGYILLWLSIKKESDARRKRALILVATYAIIIFLILFPVSSSLSIRYFIVIEFVPFLLVSLWIRFFLEKIHNKFSLLCVGFFVAILIFFNTWTIKDTVVAFHNKTASTDNVAYFGEVEQMSTYVLENSHGSKTIYVAGKKAYLSRYGKQLEYFGKQQGVIISKAYKTDTITTKDSFFYILKKISQKKSLPEVMKGFTSEKGATFGNVTIIKLERNP